MFLKVKMNLARI